MVELAIFWPRVRLSCVVRTNCIVGLFLGDKFSPVSYATL